MAQHIRALPALTRDPDLVPSIHNELLTPTVRGALFWPPQEQHAHGACIHSGTHTDTLEKSNLLLQTVIKVRQARLTP